MATTNGISNYSVGGAAPLSRPASTERPRETQASAPAPEPKPSTVVQISPQARELAAAAAAEQQQKKETGSEG